MIHYDPGYWSIGFAFSLHGSVFPKAFVFAAASSAVAVLLRILIDHNEQYKEALQAGGASSSTVLNGFTFILGFLVVFRSQKAYSRWWEGGTLMQQLRGEWFNAASNLVAFCNRDKSKHDEVLKFQHQLVRLVSLLYASALQQICTMGDQCFHLIDISGFDKDSLEFLQSAECHDHCEVVLQWIQRLVVLADSDKTIDVAAPILSRVYNQLGNGIVNLNNARKITEFPIPFPLAQMIAVMLLIHWIVTPLMCATVVDSNLWAGFLTFVVVFSFWSINYIAIELEMPFGDDANDLPLHSMQRDLNASLITLMQDKAIYCPEFNFDPAQHCALLELKVNPTELTAPLREETPQHYTLRSSIKHIRQKFGKERTGADSRWQSCLWPLKKREKEEKFESAPMLREDFLRNDGARMQDIAALSSESCGQEDDMQLQEMPGQEQSTNFREDVTIQVPLADVMAQEYGARDSIEREQGGISPSQVGVPAHLATESPRDMSSNTITTQPRDVISHAITTQLANADPSNGSANNDPFLQSGVYHCHHHHHHRIEMEQAKSEALPPARTNRCLQNGFGDSCFQFVNSSTTPTALPAPVSSSSRQVDSQAIAASAYRAVRQTIV